MREKLTQLFGLSPMAGQTGVSDEQIIEAASKHKAKSDAAEAKRLEEKEITDLVTQSCGALTRKAAKEVLDSRKGSFSK